MAVSHGDSTIGLKCKGCGREPVNDNVVTVEGVPCGICKTPSCVDDGRGSLDKGVVVEVEED